VKDYMKLFSLLMVGLLLGLMGCSDSLKTPARGPDSFHRQLGDSTVALVAEIHGREREDGPEISMVKVYCTGVWISRDEILTAGHCAEGIAKHLQGVDQDSDVVVDPVNTKVHFIVEKEVDQVGTEPTAIHLGYVKAWDEDTDLALVKVTGKIIPDHAIVSLVRELPGVGERVFCVGHPKGMYWSYVEGTVSAYRDTLEMTGKTGPFVQINAAVYYGNSGGGVFDTSGRLLGIASMLGSSPNMALYVHPDSIKKFLSSVDKKVVAHKEQAGL
jgi:S1-C subfamily serine protease